MRVIALLLLSVFAAAARATTLSGYAAYETAVENEHMAWPELAVSVALAPEAAASGAYAECSVCAEVSQARECRTRCAVTAALTPFATYARVNITNNDASRGLACAGDGAVALLRTRFTVASDAGARLECATATALLETVRASVPEQTLVRSAATRRVSEFVVDHVAALECLPPAGASVQYDVQLDACVRHFDTSPPSTLRVNASTTIISGTCSSLALNTALNESLAAVCSGDAPQAAFDASTTCDTCTTLHAAEASVVVDSESLSDAASLEALRPDVYALYDNTASRVVHGAVVYVPRVSSGALTDVLNECDGNVENTALLATCDSRHRDNCVARRFVVWLLYVVPEGSTEVYEPLRGQLHVRVVRHAFHAATNVSVGAVGAECGVLHARFDSPGALNANAFTVRATNAGHSNATTFYYTLSFEALEAREQLALQFYTVECTEYAVQYDIEAAYFTDTDDLYDAEAAAFVCRARGFVDANNLRCWQRRSLRFGAATDAVNQGNVTCDTLYSAIAVPVSGSSASSATLAMILALLFLCCCCGVGLACTYTVCVAGNKVAGVVRQERQRQRERQRRSSTKRK